MPESDFSENPNAVASSTNEVVGGVFGTGWQNLTQLASDEGSTGAVVGVLLQIFSATIIGITILVVVIVLLTSMAETANKGKIGGDYMNMWWPVRSILAPFLIFPISGGYSLLQVAILGLVVNLPIQTADLLTVTSAKLLVQGGASFSNPAHAQQNDVANQVMYSEICRAYYNEIEFPNLESDERIAAPKEPEASNAFQAFFGAAPIFELSYNLLDEDGDQAELRCGGYRIACQNSDDKTEAMCLQQAQSLYLLGLESRSIATRFITEDGYIPSLGELARIQSRYQTRVTEAVRFRVNSDLTDEDKKNREKFIEFVERDGFFGAGRYYMTHTQISQYNARLAQPNTEVLPFELEDSVKPEQGIGVYLSRAEKYLSGRSNGLTSPPGTPTGDAALRKERELARLSGGGSGGYLSQKLESANQTVFFNRDPLSFAGLELRQAFDYDEDPITGIQSLGNFLITTSSVMMSTGAVANIVTEATPMKNILGSIRKKVNKTRTRDTTALDNVTGQIGGLLMSLMTIAFFLGAILLYYVPSVPFIIWTMGCVGYVITIFETLMAATIWMASHVMPQGEGFASEHSKAGYGLLINLAIRPPVMVIGLVGGAAVMHVCVSYFVSSFHTYAIGLMTDRVDLLGVLTWVFLTVIEVAIVIFIIHKTHSMVFESPDNIVRWITSNVRPTGEDGDSQRLSGVLSSTQNRADQQISGAVSNATSPGNRAKEGTSNQSLR